MALILDTVYEKYVALIPNYNIEIEKYKEKHNLLSLDLSLKARLQDWEGIMHPIYLVKPIF